MPAEYGERSLKPVILACGNDLGCELLVNKVPEASHLMRNVRRRVVINVARAALGYDRPRQHDPHAVVGVEVSQ